MIRPLSFVLAVLWLATVLTGCDRRSAAGPGDDHGAAGDPPEHASGRSTPEEIAPAPRADSRAPTAEELRAAPRGDRPWATAIFNARRGGTLPQLLDLAAGVARRHPDRWEPQWTVAECHYYQRRPEKAAEQGRRAHQLALDADDPTGIALSAYRLGWLAFLAGELEEGDRHYRTALRAARHTERPDLRAQILNGRAGLLIETGRYGEAHRLLAGAIEALESIGSARFARRLALNRAVILMLLGDAGASLEILERTYDDSVRDGDDYVVPRTALTLGNLHRRMHRDEEAAQWYARVSDDEAELAGLSHLSQGLIAMRLDDLDAAREHLDRAAGLTGPVDGLLVEAYRAETDLVAGDPRRAVDRAGVVVAAAGRMSAENVSWIARWIEGRAWLALGREDRAIASLRDAAAILDRQGAELDPMEEGLRYLRERSDVYSDLAFALCGDGVDAPSDPRAGAVLEAMERTHARALRSVLAPGEAVPGPPDLSALMESLRPGEVILDYAVGRDRGVVLAVRNDRVAARPIPGWSDISEPLRRYRNALQRPLRSAEARAGPAEDFERSLRHGEALRQALVDPVRPMLDGAERLYVVPDRELALLPFAALPAGGGDASWAPRFLGDRVEIAVMPLAGTPRTLGRIGPPVLLAGDPLPAGGGLPRLPQAARELDAIRDVWGVDGTTVLRAAALRSHALRRRLEDSPRVIHLATHASASTRDPSRCAVFLSGGDRIGIDTVTTLPLRSSLVMLSACSTGGGELVPGEGVIGLGWAFLRAGASAVGVSLWNVEDASATELMIAFHRLLRQGEDPVRALANARREVAQHTPHPAYWAPFVMVVQPETPSPYAP